MVLELDRTAGYQRLRWPGTAEYVFPGCDRAAQLVQAHHRRHRIDCGPTDLANLALLCRFHHRLVHEGGRTLTRDDAGGWTTGVRTTATSITDDVRGGTARLTAPRAGTVGRPR